MIRANSLLTNGFQIAGSGQRCVAGNLAVLRCALVRSLVGYSVAVRSVVAEIVPGLVAGKKHSSAEPH